MQVAQIVSSILLEGCFTLVRNQRSVKAFEDLGRRERSMMQKRRLKACRHVKLYYLVRGRNAWRKTQEQRVSG